MSVAPNAIEPKSCLHYVTNNCLADNICKLVKKIQTSVANIFYTICYFAIPSMRTSREEILNELQSLDDKVWKLKPNRIHIYYSLGNQSYEGTYLKVLKFIRNQFLTISRGDQARPWSLQVDSYHHHFGNGQQSSFTFKVWKSFRKKIQSSTEANCDLKRLGISNLPEWAEKKSEVYKLKKMAQQMMRNK